MKKVGLFGGTFDPIHFGHINLALELKERHSLDLVEFCPARQTPFKQARPPAATPEHRMRMISLGIEGIEGFSLCLLECKRAGISYTIDTLRELQESYALKSESVELYLLLSSDSLAQFHHWQDAKELVSLAHPLIGIRSGVSFEIPDSPMKEELRRGLTLTTQMEISSTLIRSRLKKGLYCGHLVPTKVLDYIQKHRLYYTSSKDQ
jgi:nicotinate-nucleotide adenylyltransferase